MTPKRKTRTVVVMTLCNRPEYTREVLNAFSRCDSVELFPVALSCEPVNDEVIQVAEAWASEMSSLYGSQYFVNVGRRRVGCNVNTYYALSVGFDAYERVIALEDDTVPGRDFLRYMAWALDTYEHDQTVFSVCGYQRTPKSEVGFRNAVVREKWFTPWGWATWRDRWESVRDSWPAHDSQISWDTVIDKLTRRDRYEVRPILSRIQNIGAEGGTHVPSAEWHRAYHLNPHWIETVPGPRVDEWHEVPSSTTQAMRAAAPC